MEIGKMQQQPQGYKTFVFNPFPPASGFPFSPALLQKASSATVLLGKLDGVTQLLPDLDFFLFMYVRKDAASSSQIEGTKATMTDSIEAESGTSTQLPADVDDILHYIQALNYGLERLKDFPVSLRFIKEVHKELMEGARSTHFADPGNFRNSQNWIGGTSPSKAHFVPPSPHDMQNALKDLEQFLHKQDALLPLVKAGIIHAHFETIHPFLDGNGRTGRILITLFLWLQGLVKRPVLFLSSYFKEHQNVYYQRLDGYRLGKVEEWLDFFLDGVVEVATEALSIAERIRLLRDEDIKKIQSLDKIAQKNTLRILPQLFKLPIVNVATLQKWTGFSRQGAQKMVARLVKLGILEQKDADQKYGRSFIYRRYVELFEATR